MRHLTGGKKLSVEHSLFSSPKHKTTSFKKQNALFLLHEYLGLLTDADFQPSGPMGQIQQFITSEGIYFNNLFLENILHKKETIYQLSSHHMSFSAKIW